VFEGDEATNEWLDAQESQTAANYRLLWNKFLSYVGITGDKILEHRAQDKKQFWERKTLAFKKHMKSLGHADLYARQATVAVRSFFGFHRVELKFRRTERTRLRQATRKTEDYRFNLNDLQEMAQFSDLEEQYIIIAGKSFGLRAGDFLKLTRGDLAPYIDREPPISIGEYATEKEGVSAYPFIDRDAQPIIKRMLEKMDRGGRTESTERMLTFKNEIGLTRTLQRIVGKAGIKVGNKRVRFHCLRKFLTDRLSDVMSESKWKQVVGKTVSESAYVSSDQLREDYTRAVEKTCFVQPGAEDVDIKVAESILKLAGVKDHIIAKIKREKGIKGLFQYAKEMQAKAGGLPFQVQAAKTVAEIFRLAMEELKKDKKEET